ncbi:MAG: hypothetical protein WBV46_20670 [Terriglobales bacterium]
MSGFCFSAGWFFPEIFGGAFFQRRLILVRGNNPRDDVVTFIMEFDCLSGIQPFLNTHFLAELIYVDRRRC